MKPKKLARKGSRVRKPKLSHIEANMLYLNEKVNVEWDAFCKLEKKVKNIMGKFECSHIRLANKLLSLEERLKEIRGIKAIAYLEAQDD